MSADSTNTAGSQAAGSQAMALEVLREVWRSQGQGVADLGDDCEKSCKRMTDAGVGFEDFASTESSAGHIAEGGEDAGLTAAWRARLRREGKYNGAGGTLRDLVMGPASAGRADSAG